MMGQDEDDVRDLLDRAQALRRQCKYAEALPLAQRAVEVAPQSLEAWRALGWTYGFLERVEDLEYAFEQAMRLAAMLKTKLSTRSGEVSLEEVGIWLERGIVENNANAWDRAVRTFTQLAELEPDWGVPWLMCGMALDNMGTFIDPGYYKQTLAAVDHALTLGLSHVTDERIAYELKVSALFGLGRREEAEVCRQKAAELRRAEEAEKTLEAEANPPTKRPGGRRSGSGASGIAGMSDEALLQRRS